MSKPWKTTITVPAETRGFGEHKRELPALEAKLEITIDWDKIANHFGAKAARSKGKRASMLGGRIKIKAAKVTPK
jgi:hypothetical protein